MKYKDMKYIVGLYIDDVYEVWNIEEEKQEFKGSLAECEAWVRLQEKYIIYFQGAKVKVVSNF
jgi:hypothetical protein